MVYKMSVSTIFKSVGDIAQCFAPMAASKNTHVDAASCSTPEIAMLFYPECFTRKPDSTASQHALTGICTLRLTQRMREGCCAPDVRIFSGAKFRTMFLHFAHMPFGTTHLNRDRARRGTASAMVRGEGHFPVPRPILSVAKGNREGVPEARIVTNYGRSAASPIGRRSRNGFEGPAKPWRGLARERFWLTGKESKNICIQAERWINNRMRFLYICQNRGRPGSMLRRFDNARWNSPGRSALQQCYFRLGERYEQYNMVGRCYRDHPCNSRILWVPLGLHKAV
ncbi:hypothetical protein QFZ34_001051 [Phyllobacterium ifriqiyense]|uniref:Uncharacterized protein n=1 Tax=Phyllobacterium ifriqiyense TaxID=314238 RepID=A0ABU0S563_9HYPH|nr:hypothetical protein [Phyllobacterium ifriqiyense]